MTSTFKISFYTAAALAAIIGMWLAHLWQAEKQVALHTDHFVREIAGRDWSGAGDFLADDYRDDWGHDRSELLNRLHLVLRQFTSLKIDAPNPQVSANAPAGWWSAKVQIDGMGSEFVPQIVERVNSVTEPFVLHWRRESWRPWDWKLVRVSNPALDISRSGFFSQNPSERRRR